MPVTALTDIYVTHTNVKYESLIQIHKTITRTRRV